MCGKARVVTLCYLVKPLLPTVESTVLGINFLKKLVRNGLLFECVESTITCRDKINCLDLLCRVRSFRKRDYLFVTELYGK